VGVVLPFRWIEIEGWKGELKPGHITRQSVFSSTWDDAGADFHSSDDTLNRIWDLCKYSIKATTFAGVYVDGDRERIPYEADAYLNQLSHYYTDTDIEVARDTYDHLMKHGTWPTEWGPHMVFMAHADWTRTGDKKWLAPRYEALKQKLLLDRVGPDGLVVSDAQNIKKTDIVDWPKGERDKHVFTEHNTVVNAFHLRAVALMAEMARALGKTSDANDFVSRARSTHMVFQQKFFDPQKGIYRDGTGTEHSSQHSNLFPLAFGLVPPEHRAKVAEWTAKRGMKCSVYAAQYLMEGLFENGMDEEAMGLILADNDRSWKHMVNSGTTISWEAWDLKYKPNQDWNHAWGAAPANILPRYVLGAEATTPGWATARVRPHTSGLTHAKGKVPTPRGSIIIDWKHGDTFQLNLALPTGMTAQLDLPAGKASKGVTIDGKAVQATRQGKRWIVEAPVTGSVKVVVK
jgi:alpha-L-rhamnosidase